MTKTCAVCERPLLARGYCKRHYRRFMAYGDPLAVSPRARARQEFTDTEKRCVDCGEWKPKTDFSPNKETSSGCNSYCHPCASKRAVAHAKKPAYQAKAKARRRKRTLQQGYGMTVEHYEHLLKQQGGGCAVCGTTPDTQRWGRLAVDHDHETDAVRGLLCHLCNTALGCAGDDPERLRRLADYLETS